MTLEEGDACLVFPHTLHSIGAPEGMLPLYDVLKLDVNQFTGGPSYGPPVNQLLMDAFRQQLCPVFRKDIAADMELPQLTARCVRLAAEQPWGYDLQIRSELYILLTRILRRWMAQGFTVRPGIYSSPLLGSVDSVTGYIESHLRDSLRVEQVAAHCGMSYNTFSRRFRQLYGISCKEYIEQVRLARVEHYLRFTDWDLNYISQ